ncbi:MAG: CaiB/BaiF CoA transferase family protein [Alphaproteobacteria bacterium]
MGASSSLSGIRALDLSQFTPGPYASLMLADFGADVLKIEPPSGDPQRSDGPIDSDGIAASYKVINRGKRVLKLDLKSDEGRASFSKLVQRADILLESFRPGVLDRLGFGRKELEALNPRLIHCALSGWGQTGPYRLRPGHDLNYMALGGGLIASGSEDTPVMTTPPVADFAGSLLSVTSILAALHQRERVGVGCFIDVALAESVLAWLSIDLTNNKRPGSELRRARSAYNGGLACYQIYRTADDRFLTLGIIEEKFWRNFCDAMGRQDWLPRQWEPIPQHKLISELAEAFQEKPLSEWEKLLDSVETCFHSVVNLEELAGNPQIAARQLLFESKGGDPFSEILLPVCFNGESPSPRSALREITVSDAIAAWELRPR